MTIRRRRTALHPEKALLVGRQNRGGNDDDDGNGDGGNGSAWTEGRQWFSDLFSTNCVSSCTHRYECTAGDQTCICSSTNLQSIYRCINQNCSRTDGPDFMSEVKESIWQQSLVNFVYRLRSSAQTPPAPVSTPRNVISTSSIRPAVPTPARPTPGVASPPSETPSTSRRIVNAGPAPASKPPASSSSPSNIADTSDPSTPVSPSDTSVESISGTTETSSSEESVLSLSSDELGAPSLSGGDGDSALSSASMPSPAQNQGGNQATLSTSVDDQGNTFLLDDQGTSFTSSDGQASLPTSSVSRDPLPPLDGPSVKGPGLAIGAILGIACGTILLIALIIAAC